MAPPCSTTISSSPITSDSNHSTTNEQHEEKTESLTYSDDSQILVPSSDSEEETSAATANKPCCFHSNTRLTRCVGTSCTCSSNGKQCTSRCDCKKCENKTITALESKTNTGISTISAELVTETIPQESGNIYLLKQNTIDIFREQIKQLELHFKSEIKTVQEEKKLQDTAIQLLQTSNTSLKCEVAAFNLVIQKENQQIQLQLQSLKREIQTEAKSDIPDLRKVITKEIAVTKTEILREVAQDLDRAVEYTIAETGRTTNQALTKQVSIKDEEIRKLKVEVELLKATVKTLQQETLPHTCPPTSSSTYTPIATTAVPPTASASTTATARSRSNTNSYAQATTLTTTAIIPATRVTAATRDLIINKQNAHSQRQHSTNHNANEATSTTSKTHTRDNNVNIIVRGIKSNASIEESKENLKDILVHKYRLISDTVWSAVQVEWFRHSELDRNNEYNNYLSVVKITLPTSDLAKRVLREKRKLMVTLQKDQVYIDQYVTKQKLQERKVRSRTKRLEEEVQETRKEIENLKRHYDGRGTSRGDYLGRSDNGRDIDHEWNTVRNNPRRSRI
jgi:hypothetical protein